MSDAEKELDHLRRLLDKERTAWDQERRQYQQRITELQTAAANKLPAVMADTQRKKEIKARVETLRAELEKPHGQAERNALAMELAQLEPQIG